MRTTKLLTVVVVLLSMLTLSSGAARAEPCWSVVVAMNRNGLTGDAGLVYPDAEFAPTVGAHFRHEFAPDWFVRTGLETSRRGGSRRGAFVVVTSIPEMGVSDTTRFGASTRVWSQSWLDVPLVVERRLGAGHAQPYLLAGAAWARRVGGTDGGEALLPDPERVRANEFRVLGGVGLAFHDGPHVLMVELQGATDLLDLFAAGDGPSGRCPAVSLRLELAP